MQCTGGDEPFHRSRVGAVAGRKLVHRVSVGCPGIACKRQGCVLAATAAVGVAPLHDRGRLKAAVDEHELQLAVG